METYGDFHRDASPADDAPQPATILLVEDEALIAISQRALLEAHGYRVEHVADGEEAVERAVLDATIDLVLMDINLGAGISGTEAAHAILERRDLPIVFLSSHSDPEVIRRTESVPAYGYVVKHSGEGMLLHAVRAALRLFRRHRRELARHRHVSKHEALYRAGAAHFPNGIIAMVGPDGRFISAAGEALKSAGLTSETIEGRRLGEIYPPEVAERDEPRIQDALAGRKTDTTVHYQGAYHRVITAPIPDDEGEVAGAMIMTQDVTELVEARNRLSESLAQLSLAVDSAGFGLWQMDVEQNVLTWHPPMHEIYGIPEDGAPHTFEAWLGLLHSDDRHYAREILAEVERGETIRSMRFRIIRPDGSLRHIEASIRPIWRDARLVAVVGMNMDRTEWYEQQSRLEQMLRERATLLQESNHRIKNNLMTVDTLVGLAEERHGVELSTVRGQVAMIGMVHDRLSRSDGSDRVAVDELIARIVDTAVAMDAAHGIAMNVKLDPVEVPPRTATAIGLIANELITNAIKHAARDDGTLRIDVALECVADSSSFRFSVTNDGARPVRELEIGQHDGVGLRLVRALVDQVDGTLTVESDQRTSFVVRVPRATHPGVDRS